MNGQICLTCTGTGHSARLQKRAVNIPPVPPNQFAEMARARAVIANSFAIFKAFHENAIGPTMKNMAARSAGHCLWVLGLEEYDGFVAVPLEGPVIELNPQMQIQKPEAG